LTSNKNQLDYNLLHQHHQPPFWLKNAEGKHPQLAYCCMAIGWFINPVTGSLSSKTSPTYHFAENGAIMMDKNDWQKDCLFLDDLEDVLNGTVKCHAINKCSTITVYYITSQPQEVHTK
jgi:hypothetical protein